MRMFWKWRGANFLFLFGLITILGLPSRPAMSADWQALKQGLSYRHAADATRSFDLFRIDLTRFSISPIVPEFPTNARRMGEDTGALLTLNANFFDPHKKPLGLVIRGFHLINPLRPISWWGVFLVENHRATIIPQKQFNYRESIETAIQSGPRLIEAGIAVADLKPRSSPKSFICIQSPSQVILGISQNFISVTDLIDFLKTQLKCTDALNLDGGSSSQLYAKIGSFELDLSSPVTVPVGLSVFKKK